MEGLEKVAGMPVELMPLNPHSALPAPGGSASRDRISKSPTLHGGWETLVGDQSGRREGLGCLQIGSAVSCWGNLSPTPILGVFSPLVTSSPGS